MSIKVHAYTSYYYRGEPDKTLVFHYYNPLGTGERMKAVNNKKARKRWRKEKRWASTYSFVRVQK